MLDVISICFEQSFHFSYAVGFYVPLSFLSVSIIVFEPLALFSHNIYINTIGLWLYWFIYLKICYRSHQSTLALSSMSENTINY